MAKKQRRAPRPARRVVRVQAESPAPPELIVVTRGDEAVVEGRAGAARPRGLGGIDRILRRAGAELEPLFGVSPERIQMERAGAPIRAGATLPRLERFYKVSARRGALKGLARELAEHPAVEGAYVKPGTQLPVVNRMRAGAAPAPPATPAFGDRQGYLDRGPGGVDARFAWTQPGGRGDGIRIIDIEGGWRFSHEDLLRNQGGLAGGTAFDDVGWRNHGTAVLGEMGGDENPFGVNGICPAALLKAISHGGIGSARAIKLAASMLGPGDIILLEMHRPGPRFKFQDRPQDQRGYIAVEWWPDDFEAIRAATAQGIIVVEAAGNGAESLDDALYDAPAQGFPRDWRNPFKRGPRDSGAIIVGAGAPPPGTHGHDWGPDRSRLDFSNSGECVDAQGWGREVTTTGYGDLQGGQNEDFWYTDEFAGTSSASPIVVGVLASLQGMLKAKQRPLLTPSAARQLLRSTGAPQQPGPNGSQRIGNRPDLRELATHLVQTAPPGAGPNRPVVQIASCDDTIQNDGTWRVVAEDVANPGNRVIVEIVDGTLNVTWQNSAGEHRTEDSRYVEIM